MEAIDQLALLRFVERALLSIGGILLILLGYSLHVKQTNKVEQELSIKAHGVSAVLKRISAGSVMITCGAFIILALAFSPMHISQQEKEVRLSYLSPRDYSNVELVAKAINTIEVFCSVYKDIAEIPELYSKCLTATSILSKHKIEMLYANIPGFKSYHLAAGRSSQPLQDDQEIRFESLLTGTLQ